MEFEWDLSKERANLRKHGVSFSEAVETFLDAHGFQLTDQTHSEE
ncbi:MAG: BrnT family toxin, partial [Acidiferrobacteraceae bacterium]